MTTAQLQMKLEVIKLEKSTRRSFSPRLVGQKYLDQGHRKIGSPVGLLTSYLLPSNKVTLKHSDLFQNPEAV